jgi:hypothetical protein
LIVGDRWHYLTDHTEKNGDIVKGNVTIQTPFFQSSPSTLENSQNQKAYNFKIEK